MRKLIKQYNERKLIRAIMGNLRWYDLLVIKYKMKKDKRKIEEMDCECGGEDCFISTPK